ncbi:hypothetical protein BDW62DRAFT_152459 [Aspergillus aurantiobrunneus]
MAHRILRNVNLSSGGQLIKTTLFDLISFSFILLFFGYFCYLYLLVSPCGPSTAIEGWHGTDVIWILYPLLTIMI